MGRGSCRLGGRTADAGRRHGADRPAAHRPEQLVMTAVVLGVDLELEEIVVVEHAIRRVIGSRPAGMTAIDAKLSAKDRRLTHDGTK